jgi:hypothetical protein
VAGRLMRRRYRYLGVGLAAVIAVAAVVIVLVWSGGRGAGRGASVTPGLAGRDQADIAAVVRLLTGLPARAAAGDTSDLAPSLRVTPAAVRKLIPPGSVIRPDSRTWRRTGAVASITLVLRRPGRGKVEYVAVMFRERDGWKLAQTFPWAATGSAPTPGAGGGT